MTWISIPKSWLVAEGMKIAKCAHWVAALQYAIRDTVQGAIVEEGKARAIWTLTGGSIKEIGSCGYFNQGTMVKVFLKRILWVSWQKEQRGLNIQFRDWQDMEALTARRPGQEKVTIPHAWETRPPVNTFSGKHTWVDHKKSMTRQPIKKSSLFSIETITAQVEDSKNWLALMVSWAPRKCWMQGFRGSSL